MKVSRVHKEHDESCSGRLVLYAVELGDSVHIEMVCEECGFRSVADIYELEPTNLGVLS